MGPLVAYPGVDLQAGYNDNLHLTNANVISSSLSVISPYVKLEAKVGANVYDIQYRSDEDKGDQDDKDHVDERRQVDERLIKALVVS